MSKTIKPPVHNIRLNYVSRHATDRYCEAHTGTYFDDLVQAFESGTLIDYGVVVALTGRHIRRAADPKCERFSTYVLCPARLGLFVVKEGALITYIRLGLAQAEWAAKMYPVGCVDGAPAPSTQTRRAAVAS